MNPSNTGRLTVVEIREPLTRLEAEYTIYREATERYHSHTEKILKDVLTLLSKAQVDTDTPSLKSKKPNGRKITERLTRREVQVIGLIAGGYSTKQLASALGITFKTAVGHRSSLMKKLAIHDTASLVRYAIRSGLIEA